MEKEFELILDKDEQIIKTYKPSKLKVFLKSIVYFTFLSLIMFGNMALIMFTPDEIDGSMCTPIWCLLPIGLFVLSIILVIVFTSMYYKKHIYAYTNKRVIIRTGIIGVDYKSLDMSMIGAMDVYVSLLDKIIGKHTGTIRFGSTSSPINGASMYTFASIVQPYEVYKELKNYIDVQKSNQK